MQSVCNANKKVGEMNYKLKAFFVRYNFTSDGTKSIRGHNENKKVGEMIF